MDKREIVLASKEEKERVLGQIQRGFKELRDVKIGDERYKELTEYEQKVVILKEFLRCHLSAEYFVRNYVKVKHPRLGIIKANPFDYQLDVINRLDITYQVLDSELRRELLLRYKYRFDFKKWWKEEIEKSIELVKLVPPELKEQYTLWINSPFWRTGKYLIINKSRQVGISTITRMAGIKFMNFHPSAEIVIISKSDKDSTKFLQEAKIIYKNLPDELKFPIVKDNDHEFAIDLSGTKEITSGFYALAPTPTAGSGYSPTLLVLDELSKWERNVEQAFTSATMALTSGGLLVIIGTPYGIGNLFYRMWVESIKRVVISLGENVQSESLKLYSQFQTEDENKVGGGVEVIPYVVHWTQIPDEEYQRRGFKNKLEWYYSECAKLQWDYKKINQELNLKFFGSGETVFPPPVLEFLNSYCNVELKLKKEGKSPLKISRLEQLIEGRALPQPIEELPPSEFERLFRHTEKYLPYLRIFEPPTDEKDVAYIIGVDTAEGVGGDYSTAYVFKVPNISKQLAKLSPKNLQRIKKSLLMITSTETPDLEVKIDELLKKELGLGETLVLPKVVAEFYFNKIPPLDFARLLILLGIYYGGGYFNIERNKDGLGVIQNIAELYYDPDYILNEYRPDKKFPNNFTPNKKGWSQTQITRTYLLTTFKNYIMDNLDLELLNEQRYSECDCPIDVPKSVALELLTFEVKPNGRWEHIEGSHDDGIFGFSLGLVGGLILPSYLAWLEQHSKKPLNPRPKTKKPSLPPIEGF